MKKIIATAIIALVAPLMAAHPASAKTPKGYKIISNSQTDRFDGTQRIKKVYKNKHGKTTSYVVDTRLFEQR